MDKKSRNGEKTMKEIIKAIQIQLGSLTQEEAIKVLDYILMLKRMR